VVGEAVSGCDELIRGNYWSAAEHEGIAIAERFLFDEEAVVSGSKTVVGCFVIILKSDSINSENAHINRVANYYFLTA
jgi:hypothetical protein